MKLATIKSDRAAFPILVEDERALRLDTVAPSIQAIIERGAEALDAVRALREDARSADWMALDRVRYAPPVERPGKFVCVGLNFRDHAAEGGHAIPDYPALFLRVSTSLTGHLEPVARPRTSTQLDYEAELVVVIGTRCRHVSEDEALSAVFGYTAFNDLSLRDYQKKSAQWTAGKNFDGTGSVGPFIVTADALPKGAEGIGITCDVNGQRLQDGNTNDMIFPVKKIISILSEFMTLEPGDHIAMGTPAGVGFARKPPIWLKPGDTVDIGIEGIGHLTNTIYDEGQGQ